MGNRIFINYRREDTRIEARLLYEFLSKYDTEFLFYDKESIEKGADFIEKLKNTLKKDVDTILVLIGSHWVYEIQKRIETGSEDYVLSEIEWAFAFGLTIIPVLFDVKMPQIGEIEKFQRVELKHKFGNLNAKEIRVDLIDSDFEQLATKDLNLKLKNTNPIFLQKEKLITNLRRLENEKTECTFRLIEIENEISKTKYEINSLKNIENSSTYNSTESIIEMICVEGGVFDFGSNQKNEVTVNTFKIGRCMLTRKIWKYVMGKDFKPMYFTKGGEDMPVDSISWLDAKHFIEQLNKKTNSHYRLPTEIEWEFAASGGIKSKNNTYSGSDDIEKVAWYFDNSGYTSKDGVNYIANSRGPREVRLLNPNELGIYDMSGNLWEWCEDRYIDIESPEDDIEKKVCKGGSWRDEKDSCSICSRDGFLIDARRKSIGLRLACNI